MKVETFQFPGLVNGLFYTFNQKVYFAEDMAYDKELDERLSKLLNDNEMVLVMQNCVAYIRKEGNDNIVTSAFPEHYKIFFPPGVKANKYEVLLRILRNFARYLSNGLPLL